MCTYMHTYMHTNIHTCIKTCIHACIQTYERQIIVNELDKYSLKHT